LSVYPVLKSNGLSAASINKTTDTLNI